MTPNEYVILRMFGDNDSVAVHHIAGHMRNSVKYTKYLCAGMVNAGLLAECLEQRRYVGLHARRA